MSEKELSTIQMSVGTDANGHFEYVIHEVINEGIKQYRLRLWDCKDKLKVRFAKSVHELQLAAKVLLKESAA